MTTSISVPVPVPEPAARARSGFAERTTLREILALPEAALDHAMGVAYQLYRAGQLAEAETICKGLIACDHRYWWPHSLHAAILRRLGRPAAALAAVERGLHYEPQQPKLLLMRAELRAVLAKLDLGTPARTTLRGLGTQGGTP